MAGNISSDDAKIGGITPAALTLSGRCELWPPYIFRPTMRLAYWIGIRRCARSKNTITATTTTHDRSHDQEADRLDLPDLDLTASAEDRVGQVGDDAGEDDQRDAVADTALGDLLAEPHDERGAGRQRDASS